MPTQNHEARDALLDRMLGIPGKAQESRGKIRDTKKKLDEAGLEHKETKPVSVDGERGKGLVEDLRERLATAIGEITDNPPEGLVDTVLQTVVASVMEAPPEEVAPVPETPEGEEPEMEVMAEDEEEDEDEEEMMMELQEVVSFQNKAVKLIDTLMQSQGEIAADFDELKASVKALEGLPALLEDFNKKLARIEKQLDMRPRMASRASETEVEKDGLSKEIQESLVQRDPFWKRPLKPEGM